MHLSLFHLRSTTALYPVLQNLAEITSGNVIAFFRAHKTKRRYGGTLAALSK